jgi:hypothetical protein
MSAILTGLLLLIAACGGNTKKLADLLPLDQQKPTLIFFYTDNCPQ